ncbi:MAG: hypothetical protein RIF36_02550 [Imperialibacter sp.]|uniref:hypothetical protein n=1 Tax=Imperialibacter sp. TaxID=2038411 RepID=UPI0032EE3D6F
MSLYNPAADGPIASGLPAVPTPDNRRGSIISSVGTAPSGQTQLDYLSANAPT